METVCQGKHTCFTGVFAVQSNLKLTTSAATATRGRRVLSADGLVKRQAAYPALLLLWDRKLPPAIFLEFRLLQVAPSAADPKWYISAHRHRHSLTFHLVWSSEGVAVIHQPLACESLSKWHIGGPLVNTVRDCSYWIDNIISRTSTSGSSSSNRTSTR